MRFLFRGLKLTRLAITPPSPERGRHGVALAAILRDEERHVAEWAGFHHRAGVRHFVIYDNGSRDGTLAALRATLPPEALTIVPWDQTFRDARLGAELHNQVAAYAHAARNFGGAFRWMGFLDIDEFAVPVAGTSLAEALDALGACRNLSLPWHMFGRSGHATPPQGGVLRNFTRRAADPTSGARGVRGAKCFADPCWLTQVGVHAMRTGDAPACNDRGKTGDRDASTFYSRERIQLNHYYTRSNAELEAKLARGSNMKAAAYARRVRRTAANIEADEVEDRTAPDCLDRMAASGL